LPFAMNGWYQAAWSEEVGRTLLQRWVCDQPMCLYRTEDGEAVALADRCPHRKYPLSLGRLDGDVVECGYHGYRIDSSGTCVGVAEQDEKPRAGVLRYPTAELNGVLWVWPGEHASAGPELIPDLGWLTDPGWTHVHGLVPLKARQELLMENLLDLSHETFLHPTTIGNEAVAATPIEVSGDATTVRFSRHMLGIEPPPFYQKSMGLSAPADRWQDGEFYAPGVFLLHIRMAASGTQEPEGFHMKVFHGMTPAVEGECHDFYALGRDYLIDDAALSEFQHQQQLSVMAEDVRALEVQELMYATANERAAESSIKGDVAALRGRRIIRRMIASEQAAEDRPAAQPGRTG
jgi:phenylpropionate dioxygenase-like ring-hydroxylating dioxygenase large terminal subunit